MLTVLGGLADDAECAVMRSGPTGTTNVLDFGGKVLRIISGPSEGST
jgi:hypothetical protein